MASHDLQPADQTHGVCNFISGKDSIIEMSDTMDWRLGIFTRRYLRVEYGLEMTLGLDHHRENGRYQLTFSARNITHSSWQLQTRSSASLALMAGAFADCHPSIS